MIIRRIISAAAAIFVGWIAALATSQEDSWRGYIELGTAKMPLVLNFSCADSSVICTFDSPQQGVRGLATTINHLSTDSLSISVPSIGASYTARIGGGVMSGTFSQRGYNLPLKMVPELPLSERRPQTPAAPFPYEVRDTVFAAPDGVLLAASITLPRGGTIDRMAVFVTGSGPQNRDEEIFDHKPFAVIADYLARAGIASLRYDDRGTAKSRGNFATSDTYILKEDARAALNFARSISGGTSTGIIGHSEGGSIAFMLGAEGESDFIVSLAGMAVSGKETMLTQNRHSMLQLGIEPDSADKYICVIDAVFDSAAARGTAPGPINVAEIARKKGVTLPPAIQQSLSMNANKRTPALIAFISLDIEPLLPSVRCPVLAINGSKDIQVEAHRNISAIAAAIPHAQTYIIDSLNHLLQHAQTGEVSEYEQIRETISPEVLEKIAGFIKSL